MVDGLQCLDGDMVPVYVGVVDVTQDAGIGARNTGRCDLYFVADVLMAVDAHDAGVGDLVVVLANWSAVVDYVRERCGLVVFVAVDDGGGRPTGFCDGDVLVSLSHEPGYVERLLLDAVGDFFIKRAG